MTQETLTSQQIVDRAHQARRLLDDPTLQKAVQGVRFAILDKLEATAVTDIDLHHELALSLQSLRAVMRQLQNWVDSGTLEGKRAEVRSGIFNRKA